jgi:hypothetical protein
MLIVRVGHRDHAPGNVHPPAPVMKHPPSAESPFSRGSDNVRSDVGLVTLATMICRSRRAAPSLRSWCPEKGLRISGRIRRPRGESERWARSAKDRRSYSDGSPKAELRHLRDIVSRTVVSQRVRGIPDDRTSPLIVVPGEQGVAYEPCAVGETRGRIAQAALDIRDERPEPFEVLAPAGGRGARLKTFASTASGSGSPDGCCRAAPDGGGLGSPGIRCTLVTASPARCASSRQRRRRSLAASRARLETFLRADIDFLRTGKVDRKGARDVVDDRGNRSLVRATPWSPAALVTIRRSPAVSARPVPSAHSFTSPEDLPTRSTSSRAATSRLERMPP